MDIFGDYIPSWETLSYYTSCDTVSPYTHMTCMEDGSYDLLTSACDAGSSVYSGFSTLTSGPIITAGIIGTIAFAIFKVIKAIDKFAAPIVSIHNLITAGSEQQEDKHRINAAAITLQDHIDNMSRTRSQLINSDGEQVDPKRDDIIEKESKAVGKILALKGVYQIAASFLTHKKTKGKTTIPLEDFDTLWHKISINPNSSDNFHNSMKSFVELLTQSIDKTSNGSWIEKEFVKNIILPAARSFFEKNAINATHKFVEGLKEAVFEHSSAGGVNTKLLDYLTTMVFRSITDAVTSESSRNTLEDSRPKGEYLQEVLIGNTEERKRFYTQLTKDFFLKNPIEHFRFTNSLEKACLYLEQTPKATGISGIEKVILTAIFSVARTIIWIFRELIVRPSEFLLNKIVNFTVTKIAIKASVTQSLIESGVEVLTGENAHRGTEILDKFIIEILKRAKSALHQGVNKRVTSSTTIKLSEKERESMEDFLKALLNTVWKYSDPKGKTPEMMFRSLSGVGDETYNLLIREISPLVVDLYKTITSKDAMEGYIKDALVNIKSLGDKKYTNTDSESIALRQKERLERKERIDSELRQLSPMLNTLLIKSIENKKTSDQKKGALLASLKADLEKVFDISKKLRYYNLTTSPCLNKVQDLQSKVALLYPIVELIREKLAKTVGPLKVDDEELYDHLCKVMEQIGAMRTLIIEHQHYLASMSLKMNPKTLKLIDVTLRALKGLNTDDNVKLGLDCNVSRQLKKEDYQHEHLKDALGILKTLKGKQIEEASNLKTEKGLNVAIDILDEIKNKFSNFKDRNGAYTNSIYTKVSAAEDLGNDPKVELINSLRKLGRASDEKTFKEQINIHKQKYVKDIGDAKELTLRNKHEMDDLITKIKRLTRKYREFLEIANDQTAMMKFKKAMVKSVSSVKKILKDKSFNLLTNLQPQKPLCRQFLSKISWVFTRCSKHTQEKSKPSSLQVLANIVKICPKITSELLSLAGGKVCDLARSKHLAERAIHKIVPLILFAE